MQEQLWGTFDSVRTRLEQQYESPVYLHDTGRSPEELAGDAKTWLTLHADQSRVLQKANIYRLVLEKGRINIDPQDFFADMLQHADILSNLQAEWNDEIKTRCLPQETAWMNAAENTGYLDGVLDLGHTSPGWTTMLGLGLNDLMENAHRCRAALGKDITLEQSDFYDAVDIVYTATIHLAGRFSALSRSLAVQYPGQAARLHMVADALDNVPANPPRNFHEALQFAYLMHQMIEMEGERVRSMGGFDRLYLPFFRADIASGRLDVDQARELVKFFWIKFFAHTRGVANGKNFYFGGCLPDGSDAVNELSSLALEAYDDLDTTDPKLSVRVGRNTPDAFLAQVAKIIRQGKTAFVLVNDDIAIPALVRHGKTLEEARNYLLIGCYEPTIEGLEISCNMSLKINLAKSVELALNNGVDPVSGIALGPASGDPLEMDSFDAFYRAVLAQIDAQVDKATEYVRRFEPYWPDINPSPVLAGTFTDCLRKGRDIGQAGPKYNNTGCMGAGLANVADSLVAMKRLVFDEKRCTMSELTDALRSDFTGYEDLHRYIVYRLPKWGNDDPQADVLAKQ
ncbi:MAG TPA: pyruvate formate lyase family protein, partial [Clostridia bacterium]